MRSRIVLPLLALLVITAGCIGTDPTGTATTTATQTPTPLPESPSPTTEAESPETTASVTSPSTDCPPRLSVEPASERQVEQADQKLTFEELPPERQREFERALDGDVALESGTEDVWIGSVVRYQGELYATGVYVC